jgi:hypothetical protein
MSSPDPQVRNGRLTTRCSITLADCDLLTKRRFVALRYEEIATFKRLGREADIYCLLIAGERNATDKPECGLLGAFPLAIRFQLGPETGDHSSPNLWD